MNLTEITMRRYSTKVFDPNRTIPTELFAQLEDLLRLSPSSVNSQPWHFLVASTLEGRMRLTCATQVPPYSNNLSKLRDASHVVVFCAKTSIDDTYLTELINQEDKDGRFPEPANKDMAQKGRAFYVDQHRVTHNDAAHWMQKQVYLNLGSILLGAATLGIDAVPIEGFDKEAIDKEFGLREKGYTAVVMAAFGYHADTDFNAKLPKSRWPKEKVVTRV